MPKVVLADLSNFSSAALAQINSNNQRIEDGFDNTLSRDGSIPNQMNADIDMNENDILNVDNIDVDTLEVETLILNGREISPSEPFTDFPSTPNRYIRNNSSGFPAATGATETANLDVLAGGNFVPVLATRASALILTLTAYNTVRVKAWDGSSPIAEAQYDKVAAQPSHSGKFQDAALNWFELKSPLPDQYMFGAVGDGTADDTAALARLEAYVQVTGAHYRYKPGTHKITSRLDLQASGDMSAATINFDGSTIPIGLRFGSVAIGGFVGLNKSIWWKSPKIVNTGKSGTGWSGGNATCIGLQMSNLYEATAWLGTIVGCGVGVDCTAYSTGFSYNKIYFSKFENCKIGQRCRPGDSAAWVNENLFVGGRFHFNSGEGTNTAGTRNILCEDYDKGGGVRYNPPNHNIWLHTSIEGNTPAYHIEMCGLYNTIAWARWEATTPKMAIYSEIAEGSTYNTVLGGYGVYKLVLSTLGQYTRYTHVIDGTRLILEATSGANLPAVTASSNLGNTEATPWLQLFSASKQFLAGTDNTATDWTVRLAANGLSAKASTDTYARIRDRGDLGRTYYGDGTADPTAYIGYDGATTTLVATANGGFKPVGDNNTNLGRSTSRWSNCFATQFRPGAGSVIWTNGTGTAESSVTAPVGSLRTRDDGGYSTTLEIKQNGSGTTGWARVKTLDYQTIATDADATLTVGTDRNTIRHTGTLTANRAITLSTTGAMAGDEWLVTRTGSGAFNLAVGTGPLKNLTTNTWGRFVYDGTNWYLAAYGAL